jgi:eukaryotic-like serine/threonine-protein kinase
MDPGSPSMRLTPGQVVNGKYRVVRLLGDGGMGSVYEAHHEMLGTRVALKLLHSELSRTGMAKRFLQEARASARIKSRHVVGVADADQTPDGFAFIVLEYLEGQTLRELYEDLDREQRRLPFADALDFAMQMFEGVEAAHEAGIVHRDLKPDNVMITTDPKGGRLLKVLDFGIAKVDEPPESSAPALTRPGALLGTPEYMAPEQVYSAGTADVRSDVFSLGVILFEMLSGRRPVLSDDPQQIAVSYLTGAFTRLEEAAPEVPAPLAMAVHRAIAAQPRDRFASVAEFRSAIEIYAPARQTSLSRLSLLDPGTTGNLRPIPETRGDPPGAAVLPAPSDRGADTPLASQMAIPPPSPGFMPEYPPAGMPLSLWPPHGAAPLAPAPPSSGSAPTVGDPRAGAFPGGPPSFVYPPPAPPGASLAGWAPPAAADALAARRTKMIWIAAAVIAVLGVAGMTLGALYYLGWLDDEPERPHPAHKHPAHRPGAH